ncbi:hypothetical protein DL768_003899 [Monosporascus sp. mg162]|nr:hypothetical protein DL768_003899 [Monosporascus sp. mg162]
MAASLLRQHYTLLSRQSRLGWPARSRPRMGSPTLSLLASSEGCQKVWSERGGVEESTGNIMRLRDSVILENTLGPVTPEGKGSGCVDEDAILHVEGQHHFFALGDVVD